MPECLTRLVTRAGLVALTLIPASLPAQESSVPAYRGPVSGHVAVLAPDSLLYMVEVAEPAVPATVWRAVRYLGRPTRELYLFAVRDSIGSEPPAVREHRFSIWVDKSKGPARIGEIGGIVHKDRDRLRLEVRIVPIPCQATITEVRGEK
jgi:hypothetical protein